MARKLILVVISIGALAMLANLAPDLKRYAKIMQM